MKNRVQTIRTRLSNCYVVEAESGVILIDAGAPGDADLILSVIDDRKLNLILITHAHFDHYGSAAEIRRRTGAPIAIHEADAGNMHRAETHLGIVKGRGKIAAAFLPLVERLYDPEPTEADVHLHDGEGLGSYGLDASVVHTPGHTIGSCSLICGEDAAFVGDLLSNTGGAHLQRYFAVDWSALMPSLEKVKHYQPALIYAGHGKEAMTCEELEGL
jgi:glyoxylase-like metal-dependent hydrolase (beta-lactamase superfamily II)